VGTLAATGHLGVHPIPHPAPHSDTHTVPHSDTGIHSELRPKPPYYREGHNPTVNWLVIYIVLSNNVGHQHIEDHGQFNNVTFVSNCSGPVNISLTISGRNETIIISPNGTYSIYVNDSTCQNYTGFQIHGNNTYTNCTVIVDYSFIPCNGEDWLVAFQIFVVVIILTFAIILPIWMGTMIYYRCRVRQKYVEHP
ncbi:Hypothetical protein HVR_LOCUS757, partial [uncultured virus]